MAKPLRTKRDQKRKSFHSEHLPLGRENFRILGIGILVIAAGYAAMLQGSIEGFLPLVAAPILLVAGYCIIIPLGLLYRKSMFHRETPDTTDAGHGA